ncbi:MAG: hypothetical protein CM15mP93_16850 [Thiotrichaceae bacterium]|nr:MAG: hypothetical protein CM15mP93_16850 [Thiotrichaceae bacterium]
MLPILFLQGIEGNESLEETTKREIMEELDIFLIAQVIKNILSVEVICFLS